MTWFRVDDGLHSHRKAVRAGVPAMGLWVLAGSWCADHLTDGFIPDYMAARIDRDSEENATRLVDAGLWTVAEKGGDKGWQFHEWTEQQPTREEALTAAAKKSSGGKLGNHRRWHGDGKADPKCPFCHDAPAKMPIGRSQSDQTSDRISDRSTDQTPDRSQESVANPPTRTDPTRTDPIEVQSPAGFAAHTDQLALAGMPPPPPPPEREYSAKDMAYGVARWRIEEREAADTPIIGGGKKGALHTLAAVLLEAFEAKYTENEVRQALTNLEDGIPSKQQVNREVARVRKQNGNEQERGSGELTRRGTTPPTPRSPADRVIADAQPLYAKYKAQEQETARG